MKFNVELNIGPAGIAFGCPECGRTYFIASHYVPDSLYCQKCGYDFIEQQVEWFNEKRLEN